MYALLIDSSTEKSVVALSRDGEVLIKRELPTGHHSSRYLMPAIDEIFKEGSVSKKELAYILVGIGPGSYTGIRVAVSIGKALAFSLQIPLVGVSTLLGLIPLHGQGPFAALLDARISGVYMMKGFWNGSTATFSMPPSIVSLDTLENNLEGISHLVTSDKEKLARRLAEKYPLRSWIWEERTPSAEALAHEGHVKFLGGDFSEDTDLEILYLRRTQAELENDHQPN